MTAVHDAAAYDIGFVAKMASALADAYKTDNLELTHDDVAASIRLCDTAALGVMAAKSAIRRGRQGGG